MRLSNKRMGVILREGRIVSAIGSGAARILVISALYIEPKY